MDEELKSIKKLYGEDMMHMCRELFPTILENKGKLLEILKSSFNSSKFLYEDLVSNDLIEDFKNYIYILYDKRKSKEESKLIESPQELLNKVGYTLYECHSEENIQSFRHYYYRQGGNPIYTGGKPQTWSGEELCTFNGNRLDRCHVFFAVKKNVEEIKRENFNNPKREDEYGTSVISIQFTKDSSNTLSIKNRYNHTVNNPDATYSNNLDNIIEGLTESFEKYYGLNINSNRKINLEIPGYVLASDGKYYKYNYEINNIYYCPDNIIIDNFAVKREYNNQKERYIVLDYFILDLKEKTIKLYDSNWRDSFIDDITDIKDIRIKNNKETFEKEITIIKENGEEIYIVLDKYSRIVRYKNDYVKKIGDSFLECNYSLTNIELPKVETIGDFFLEDNISLKSIDLQNIKRIGSNFLYYNNSLINIELPNVETIGNSFLFKNNLLTGIKLPKVKKIGDKFLCDNNSLTRIELPNVKTIGNDFIDDNNLLTSLELPKAEIIGNDFLYYNNSLTNLELPNVEIIGYSFLYYNNQLTSLELPKVEIIGNDFLCDNNSLTSIELPIIKRIGSNFLYSNNPLENIIIPRDCVLNDNYFLVRCSDVINYVDREESEYDQGISR